MPETLQMLAAERTRKGAFNLAHLLRATPPEQRDWKPLERGRSIIEQVTECVLVNKKWALTLRAGVYTRLPARTVEQIERECQETARAGILLLESAGELSDAIMALSNEKLADQITAPFGTYSTAQCCLLGYWNMAYHEGQINYIQTLYGDETAHAHF